MEVILLVGLAVGVDYSLFYMRREREERRAGRSESAALAAAAATSGRAILVSGITVLIAMAGMFLSGDKTFMSFSVGTMLVVAVAMLGSLTVLPAILSKLGDRVEKGRIPFLHRLRRTDNGDGIWSRILEPACSGTRSSRPIAASAVLLALAVPALSLHTAQTGIDGISTPVVQPFVHVMDAFPGTPEPAIVAIKADDVNAAPVRAAVAELEQQGARHRRDERADQRRDEPRRHRHQGRDPARRQRHRRRLDRGARHAPRRAAPADRRPGRRRRVRRHRLDRELGGLQQRRCRARCRSCSASCSSSPSGSCSSRSARS